METTRHDDLRPAQRCCEWHLGSIKYTRQYTCQNESRERAGSVAAGSDDSPSRRFPIRKGFRNQKQNGHRRTGEEGPVCHHLFDFDLTLFCVLAALVRKLVASNRNVSPSVSRRFVRPRSVRHPICSAPDVGEASGGDRRCARLPSFVHGRSVYDCRPVTASFFRQ